MRFKLSALLILSLALPPAVSAVPAATRVVGPKIKFVQPTAKQVISDYPIDIEVLVDDFKLMAPVQFWGRVAGKDGATGHIHYQLDDSPVYATSRTKIALSSPGKSLPPGKHFLRAELVNANHQPLNPRAFADVAIVCKPQAKEHSQASAGKALSESEKKQLQGIDEQLQRVQQRLKDIKRGQ